MASGPEVKVKRLVVAQLKALGAYYFYPVMGGYGASGVPDIVGCYKGRFFGIECKAGKNRPTDLQKKNLEQIIGAGGLALVVNEDNVAKVAELLEEATWEATGYARGTDSRVTGAADE
jgi:hypothetical protein